MQNKSPLQVKSVPSVCSRLPSSLGNKAQDLGPISLALDLLLLCGFINPFPPRSVSCFTGRHLACSSHSPASMLPVGSANLLHKSPENQLYLVLVRLCCSASSLSATPAERLCSPSLFLSLSLLASQERPSLSHPSASTCYVTFLCLSFSVNKMKIIKHFSQRIWGRTEPNNPCEELRIVSARGSKHLMNKWEKWMK